MLLIFSPLDCLESATDSTESHFFILKVLMRIAGVGSWKMAGETGGHLPASSIEPIWKIRSGLLCCTTKSRAPSLSPKWCVFGAASCMLTTQLFVFVFSSSEKLTLIEEKSLQFKIKWWLNGRWWLMHACVIYKNGTFWFLLTLSLNLQPLPSSRNGLHSLLSTYLKKIKTFLHENRAFMIL